MTKFILFWVYLHSYGYGGGEGAASGTQDFQTKEACEEARDTLNRSEHRPFLLSTFCVEDKPPAPPPIPLGDYQYIITPALGSVNFTDCSGPNASACISNLSSSQVAKKPSKKK